MKNITTQRKRIWRSLLSVLVLGTLVAMTAVFCAPPMNTPTEDVPPTGAIEVPIGGAPVELEQTWACVTSSITKALDDGNLQYGVTPNTTGTCTTDGTTVNRFKISVYVYAGSGADDKGDFVKAFFCEEQSAGTNTWKYDLTLDTTSTSFTLNQKYVAFVYASKTQAASASADLCKLARYVFTVVCNTHNYALTSTTNATCTATGSQLYTCQTPGCNTTKTETIAALGHASTNGGTSGVHTKCSRCGVTLNSTHSYSSSVQTAATCTVAGTTKYTCACGYYYTQDIPAKGHSTPTTWTEDGTTRFKNCSNGCGTRMATQYKLTLTPGPGIASVSGENWYDSGGTATISCTPSAGYAFKDWTGTAILTANSNSITMDAAKSYTASATPLPYTLTFDENGGTEVADLVNYTIESTDTLPETTRIGYTFGGWQVATTVDGWAAGTYTAGTAVTGKYGTVTMVAKWNPNTYAITYNTNGGDPLADGSFVYDAGLAVLPTPTKNGYTFAGWYLGNSPVAAIPASNTAYAKDITLTAKWTAIVYTANLNFNDGNVTSESVTYTTSGGSLAPLPQPTRPGYTFKGWRVGTTVGNWVEAATVLFAPGAAIPAGYYGEAGASATHVTLVAVWEVVSGYTVTYLEAGGVEIADGTYNTENALTLPTTTRSGFIFDTWEITEVEGDIVSKNGWTMGTRYAAGTQIGVGCAGHITLTARWKGNASVTVPWKIPVSAANVIKTANTNKYYFDPLNSMPEMSPVPTFNNPVYGEGAISISNPSMQQIIHVWTAAGGYVSTSSQSVQDLSGVGKSHIGFEGWISPTDSLGDPAQKAYAASVGYSIDGGDIVTFGASTNMIQVLNDDASVGQAFEVSAAIKQDAALTSVLIDWGYGTQAVNARRISLCLELPSGMDVNRPHEIYFYVVLDNGASIGLNKYITGTAGKPIILTLSNNLAEYTCGANNFKLDKSNDQLLNMDGSATNWLQGNRQSDGRLVVISASQAVQAYSDGNGGFYIYGTQDIGATLSTPTGEFVSPNQVKLTYTATMSQAMSGAWSATSPEFKLYYNRNWYTLTTATTDNKTYTLTATIPWRGGTEYPAADVILNGVGLAVHNTAWTPPGTNYTITLTGLGTFDPTSLSYNLRDGAILPTPTRAGYTFKEWVLVGTADGWSGPYNAGALVGAGLVGNVTLQTSWIAITYQVTFDNAVLGTYDADTGLTLPPLPDGAGRVGYDFTGWTVSPAEGETSNWTPNTGPYAVGDTVGVGNYGNVELTAEWVIIEYIISLKLNAADTEAWQTVTYTVETPAILPTEIPTKNGYTFHEWTLTASDQPGWATAYAPGDTVGVGLDGHATLTAAWNVVTYTITYKDEDGTTDLGTMSYTIEDTFALLTQSHETYRFKGWMPTASVGTWNHEATEPYMGEVTGMWGDVTLIVQWQKGTMVTYVIIGTGGTIDRTEELVQIGEPAQGCTPTAAPGFHYVHWYTDEARTVPVDAAWIGEGNILKPVATEGVGEATYYVCFDLTFKTIVLTPVVDGDVFMNDQTFIYLVNCDALAGEAYDGSITVTVAADGTAYIDLPLGDYTITEKEGWNWRYILNEGSPVIGELTDASADTVTVALTYVLNDARWLNDYSFAVAPPKSKEQLLALAENPDDDDDHPGTL